MLMGICTFRGDQRPSAVQSPRWAVQPTNVASVIRVVVGVRGVNSSLLGLWMGCTTSQGKLTEGGRTSNSFSQSDCKS